MCGIAGYVADDQPSTLHAMCRSLAHRGPDDEGFHLVPGVGLSMRRLAVIDLQTGHQPIANETGDVWVIFNGEIYNFEDLRRDLAARGHVFATASDTETIVHLYEDHGIDFVQHLRGMFAIAIWDDVRRRLVIARDRIGEKPLFYFRDARGLYFGSEIKALLQARRGRDVDPQAVCDFLGSGYISGARTAFDGISRLPPAHLLVYEQGHVQVRRYWTLTPPTSVPPLAEAVDGLADRLGDAVKLCLKSDVEVGAFLSGGIDSSVLTALMRRHADVQTFTVGYEGAAKGFNELRYARQMAAHLKTRHHELILGAAANTALLPLILWHYDEPHGEPTSALVYQLSEFTRRRVKVAVGGTGGDEILYGYPRHRALNLLHLYRRLPRVVRRQVVERIAGRWPESTQGGRFAKRVRRFVAGGDQSPGHAYLGWVRLLDRDVHAALISEALGARVDDPDGDRLLRDVLLEERGVSVLSRAALLDVQGYLPDYQLTYVDRMSMAHGLEVRSPLCDFRVVEFVMGLPDDYRLRGLRSKHVFKAAATRWIPPSIVDRPKVGFDSPIGQWFKAELRDFLTAFLAPREIARSGLLAPDAVQTLLADHISGRRDYSLQLWSVLALEAWYRMYIENRVTSRADCVLDALRGVPEPYRRIAVATASTAMG